MRERIAALLAFLRRNTLRIVLFLAAVAIACMLRACYYAGQVTEVLNTNPPLSKGQVRAIEQHAATQAASAAHYKATSRVLAKRADSAVYVARTAKAQADTLKAIYEALPATSTASLPALQKQLADYTSPDTSAY